MKKYLLILPFLSFSIAVFSQNCKLNDEAKKHWYKAEAFAEGAAKDEDYLYVAQEYQEALKYAPNCPDIYFNLAYCQELLCKINPENCDEAIANYKKYLELKPNATDKGEIESKIYKIEAKKELYERQAQEKELEELNKYVGRWQVYEWNEWEKGYSKRDPFNILLSNGQLYIERVHTTHEYWADNRGKTINHLTQDKYSKIPISVNDGNLSIEYKYTTVSHGGIFSSEDLTHIYYRYKYSLQLVSPNKINGEKLIMNKWDHIIYEGKPYRKDDNDGWTDIGTITVYFEKL